MSTTIDQAFVIQYQTDVTLVFQRMGGYLRDTVRMKTGIVGTSTVFQKIAAGQATTKSRHGTITPMNQTHSAVTCSLSDFYAGDWVDKLDEAKINIDERMAIATSGAWALGRKVDNQIITELDATTQSTITVTVTSSAAVKAGLLQWIEALDVLNVPNDGNRFAIVTPRLWSQAMTVDAFARASFVGANGMSYTAGAPTLQMWKDWLGVKWKVHQDCPGIATSSAKGFAWHKNSLGYATGAFAGNNAENDTVAADITWHGDRAAHFVNHMMSGGAKLIDDTGVIEAGWNDTTAIATS